MKLSNYFIRFYKENPNDAQIASHKLMLRTSMIKQHAAGIYSWLPFGKRILENISKVIRSKMDSVASEIIMPCVQPANLWQESGRYDVYGKEMLKIKDRHENQMLFGPTHEEVVCDIFRQNIKSYKQMPVHLYQIQWKFRDEIRPRFGVMRGREFLMKDSYSFDLSEEKAIETYHRMYDLYVDIFLSMGLKPIPVKAPTGEIGGSLSHEFHIVAPTGESTIYYDERFEQSYNINFYAASEEEHIEGQKVNVKSSRAIEVGHIFYLGQKYTQAMSILVQNEKENTFPYMGCYGIGVSRIVAAIIEANHDDKGIIWPEEISPFKYSIINLAPRDFECASLAEKAYDFFLKRNIPVLLDDTENTPGAKLANNDLLGIPTQILIGNKNPGVFEIKNRRSMSKYIISDLTNLL